MAPAGPPEKVVRLGYVRVDATAFSVKSKKVVGEDDPSFGTDWTPQVGSLVSRPPYP